MSSISSNIPNGLVTALGICKSGGFTVVHIMTCRVSCAGSPRILAFITSIICAAGYLKMIHCHSCCAITRSSASQAGLP